MRQASQIQLMFLLRSLNYGGAERHVVALATSLCQRGKSVAVVTLYSAGPWRKNLEAAGVPLYTLGKRWRWDLFFFFRLIKLVQEIRPTILHGCLGTANILTVLLHPLLPHARIVWGVQASDMDLGRYGWFDRMLYRLECALSRFADLIIVNSHSGLDYAVGHGFPRKEMRVIPNGIDTDRFRPDLVLISAGFDSRVNDLLGQFTLTDRDFADLTRTVMEIADRHAGGRVVSLLEGGYNLAGLGSAAAAHVGALLGVRDAGVKRALG